MTADFSASRKGHGISDLQRTTRDASPLVSRLLQYARNKPSRFVIVCKGLTGRSEKQIIRVLKTMGKITDNTGFLFADPSFVTGLASVMDIGGSMLTYNISSSGAEADLRALASDWAVVGSDLINAAKNIGEEAEAQTKK